MKILYFVLGSPYKRLIGHRKDSYSALLKEDIVFFGPSDVDKFIYEDKEFPVIQLYKETSINEIFNKLPDCWYPDIVYVETPVLNYIYDFYNCPVLSLCSSRDAWGEMIYNRKISELFDCVYYQTVDLFAYNTFDCKLLQLIGSPTSFPESEFKSKPFISRKIDILAIANYNSGLYHERYKLFNKISRELGNKYNVRFLKGLKYDEIHHYYQDSKIVIDWSNVLSNRSYESVINGCLFFSFEDNVLIKSVWKQDVEYVSFNQRTVIEKLDYYLKNSEEANKIIISAKNKFDSLAQTPGESILKRIELCQSSVNSVQDRVERIKSIDQSELAYCGATPLYFNYQFQGHNHPQNWKSLYFDRIDKALNIDASRMLRIKQLIEAVRMAFLLGKETKFTYYNSKLEQICPEYAWIYNLQARIDFKNKRYEKAKACLHKGLKAFESEPTKISVYPLPFIDKGNSCDGRRILDYMWESVYKHKNKYQIKAFLNDTHTLLGRVYEILDDEKNAIVNYLNGLEALALPSTLNYAFMLLIRHKKYKKLLSYSRKVVDEYPYDTLSILYLAGTFLTIKQKNESRKVLMGHYNSIRSFFDKTKIITQVNMKKIVIKLLIISTFFPNKISLKILFLTINNIGHKFK